MIFRALLLLDERLPALGLGEQLCGCDRGRGRGCDGAGGGRWARFAGYRQAAISEPASRAIRGGEATSAVSRRARAMGWSALGSGRGL